MVTFNFSYISHIFILPGLKLWSFPCMSVMLKLTHLVFIPAVNVKQDVLQAGAIGLACCCGGMIVELSSAPELSSQPVEEDPFS